MTKFAKMWRTTDLSRSDLHFTLHPLVESDAPFVLHLLQSPGYIKYVGDRKVTTLEEAKAYIQEYFLAAQRKNGFGYWVVRDQQGEPAGMVGFMQREFLEHPDIGFAVAPEFYRMGVAFEGCRQALEIARTQFDMSIVEAFTSPENLASQQLLKRLGFCAQTPFTHPESNETLNRYSLDMDQ